MTTLIGFAMLMLELAGTQPATPSLWTQTERVAHPSPFASVPTALTVCRHAWWAVMLSPTGPDGPTTTAPPFDALTTNVNWERLKADRFVELHAKGGGVVFTVTRF